MCKVWSQSELLLKSAISQISLFTEIWAKVNVTHYRLAMVICKMKPGFWHQRRSDMDFGYILVKYSSSSSIVPNWSFLANGGAFLGSAHGTCNGQSGPMSHGTKWEIAGKRQKSVNIPTTPKIAGKMHCDLRIFKDF